MKLHIDTASTTFIAASEPEAVLDRSTGQPRTDRDGRPLFVVRLVAFCDGEAEVLAVRIAGAAPKGVGVSTPVRVGGLSVTFWQMGERSGLSYRAEAIEPLSPARQAS
jgi:hypothetical protein